jgi:hypothetical protein
MMTVVEETVQQALLDFRYLTVKFVIWRKSGYSMWHAWDTKIIIRTPYGVYLGEQNLNM